MVWQLDEAETERLYPDILQSYLNSRWEGCAAIPASKIT